MSVFFHIQTCKLCQRRLRNNATLFLFTIIQNTDVLYIIRLVLRGYAGTNFVQHMNSKDRKHNRISSRLQFIRTEQSYLQASRLGLALLNNKKKVSRRHGESLSRVCSVVGYAKTCEVLELKKKRNDERSLGLKTTNALIKLCLYFQIRLVLQPTPIELICCPFFCFRSRQKGVSHFQLDRFFRFLWTDVNADMYGLFAFLSIRMEQDLKVISICNLKWRILYYCRRSASY